MHFCKSAADCFRYYDFDPNNHVAEVIAHGTVAEGEDKCATNKLEIVREIPWAEVLEIVNTGKACTGRCNSGNRNSGNRNSGDWNSGDWNSGDWNSGNRNSGDWNSGNRNSGDWNSGDWNSGNRNSGDWNKTSFSNGCFNTVFLMNLTLTLIPLVWRKMPLKPQRTATPAVKFPMVLMRWRSTSWNLARAKRVIPCSPAGSRFWRANTRAV